MNRNERRAYLRELRPYLIASIIFFAIGTAIGAAVASRFPGLADQFGDSIAGFLKTFRDLPKAQLAAAIFLNNSVKTLAAILLGLAVGIVPALFLVVNGVVLGVVFFLSSYSRGVWLSLLSILPHGIIELTGVFLGTAIGLAGSFAAGKWLAGEVWRVTAFDPVAFGLVAVLLIGVVTIFGSSIGSWFAAKTNKITSF